MIRRTPCRFFEKNTGMKPDYMALDQALAARRPDVLVYQSEPLAEDLTIAGSIKPNLFVSTTGTDGDWIVKVIDVHPDSAGGGPAGEAEGGFQELVRGDGCGRSSGTAMRVRSRWCRGRRRESRSAWMTCCTRSEGHRIMIQVQSSWFPLVDRNPQTFVDIYQAKPTDFRKATQRVSVWAAGVGDRVAGVAAGGGAAGGSLTVGNRESGIGTQTTSFERSASAARVPANSGQMRNRNRSRSRDKPPVGTTAIRLRTCGAPLGMTAVCRSPIPDSRFPIPDSADRSRSHHHVGTFRCRRSSLNAGELLRDQTVERRQVCPQLRVQELPDLRVLVRRPGGRSLTFRSRGSRVWR